MVITALKSDLFVKGLGVLRVRILVVCINDVVLPILIDTYVYI